MSYNKYLFFLLFTCFFTKIHAEDGYELWLRYKPVANVQLLAEYKKQVKTLAIYGNSPTIEVAKEELDRGLSGLLGQKIPLSKTGNVIIGTPKNVSLKEDIISEKTMQNIGNEGYSIVSKKGNIFIFANTSLLLFK